MQNTLALAPSIYIKKLSFKISLKVFLIFGLLLVLCLLGFYIFQVNSVVKNSFLRGGYEKKLSEVSLENNNLKINFAQYNSLDNIENLASVLNLEKVSEVKYIQYLGTQVAAR